MYFVDFQDFDKHTITQRLTTEEEKRESIKIHYEVRNNDIKRKIMIDMRGLLFPDKVFSEKGRGNRLLPRKGGGTGVRNVYEKVERKIEPTRIYYKSEGWRTEMRNNKGRGDYIKTIITHSKPKEQSKMSEFVERLIDEEISTWTSQLLPSTQV